MFSRLRFTLTAGLRMYVASKSDKNAFSLSGLLFIFKINVNIVLSFRLIYGRNFARAL